MGGSQGGRRPERSSLGLDGRTAANDGIGGRLLPASWMPWPAAHGLVAFWGRPGRIHRTEASWESPSSRRFDGQTSTWRAAHAVRARPPGSDRGAHVVGEHEGPVRTDGTRAAGVHRSLRGPGRPRRRAQAGRTCTPSRAGHESPHDPVGLQVGPDPPTSPKCVRAPALPVRAWSDHHGIAVRTVIRRTGPTTTGHAELPVLPVGGFPEQGAHLRVEHEPAHPDRAGLHLVTTERTLHGTQPVSFQARRVGRNEARYRRITACRRGPCGGGRCGRVRRRRKRRSG